ncbi:MAG: polysaccharide deacetylase family protein [Verrucomicrobiales bacterium]|nr:polysaccharide deacetylase family protein [Verrucomicrobiales bacterium]
MPKVFLKSTALSLLARPTILRAAQRGSGTLILMFHGFRNTPNQGIENNDGKHLLNSSLNTLLSKLSKIADFISLKGFIEHLEQGIPIPKSSVILTFDDGYESNYKIAFPILQQHQAPATIFLATQFVTEGKQLWTNRLEFAFKNTQKKEVEFAREHFPLKSDANRIAALTAIKKKFKRLPQQGQELRCTEIEESLDTRLADSTQSVPAIYRPLSSSQISKMSKSGLVDFGAHTHSHRILGRCDETSIREEIQISQHKVAKLTGKPCDLFCYPNGQTGDFTELTGQLLQEAGFRCALTTVTGRNKEGCDPFTLMRIGVSDRESIDWTLLEISGILPRFRSLRGR